MRDSTQLIRLGSAMQLTQSGGGTQLAESVEFIRYDPV
jgi:hypothetical protein